MIAFNNEEAIIVAGMIHQCYRLFEEEEVFLPRGYEIRSIIRALAGVEQPVEEVFGFIAESPEQIVVAFRGTRTFQDNESDQDLYQVPYPFVEAAGKTHRGFTSIYASARDELLAQISRLSADKRLAIAGHSLGGALAVLAAVDIALNSDFESPVVYTYGSPRTGDPAFTERFNGIVPNSFRVANVHDIIPTLPDRVYPPPFTLNGLYYQHVKKKVSLAFQFNSVAVRNHEIVCYFHKLSQRSPRFVAALCASNPNFCPDTSLCVPFLGVCSPLEEEEE
ncbi:lipase family protein [Paenibacillus sp. HB172176]|uniref:lipase family protein n=1 Tax=Paenibacillus sp. HB172176 TaxID=2493690 RepID=UPI00143B8E26|nr:lipase family protein [Paenibacillus sp. HB172176]